MSAHRTVRSAPLAAGLFALLAAAAAAQPPDPSATAPEPPPHVAHEEPTPGEVIDAATRTLHETPCVGGMAGAFPCNNVDLLYHMPLSELGGATGANDNWGWTDPLTGREYALVGLRDGTAFVDVTEPDHPVRLGNLPTHTGSSTWRDVKVYQNHAFIVSEASGHGMQVFDLTELRDVVNPPVTFTETAHYGQFGSAHNIAINEDTGFAYAVGIRSGSIQCAAGLHMIDISDPLQPEHAGCFSGDGYTHDTQCVVYAGADAEHVGDEICFNSNEDTLTIVDVTDKMNPQQLARMTYAGSGYTHQGWLTDDHLYFLLDDETDELSSGHNTHTYIWDVSDLENPFVHDVYVGPVAASDHNLYTHQGHAYAANYKSGLRILSLADVASGSLTEVAFFDIHPSSDTAGTSGAWSVYPYFDSGTVIVTGIGEGLFVLRPTLCSDPDAPAGLSAVAAGDNQIELTWSGGGPGETFNVYRAPGACPGSAPELIAGGVTASPYLDAGVSGQLEHAYTVTASDPTGLCESAPSDCASATTTGPCTAEPSFGGLGSVTSPGQASCALELDWTAGTALCGPGVTYSIHRDLDPDFVPAPGNRIAEGVTGTSFTDPQVESGIAYTYVVRAVDTGNGVEDGNLVRRTGIPTGPVADGTYATGAELSDPPIVFESPGSGGGPLLHIGWHFSTDRAHAGDRSYFSTYENDACSAIVTPPVELTAGQSPELGFWTVYDIENGWDGGVVEISDDGGATWSLLSLSPGYPGSFNTNSLDACGYPPGRPSFTGVNLTWTRHTADLSPWAGEEIQVRWIFSTDALVTEEGWYVDDVEITHAQVPGSCGPGGNAIFEDGFESGDTSAWSGTAP